MKIFEHKLLTFQLKFIILLQHFFDAIKTLWDSKEFKKFRERNIFMEKKYLDETCNIYFYNDFFTRMFF